MKKRVIDLTGGARPLLDIVSYGRAGQTLTAEQRAFLERTVRGVPEVTVKVSGGARTLRGVGQHMKYIGRGGNLALESDTGERIGGKDFHKKIIDDWDLQLDAHRRTGQALRRGRATKLVHNLIFSMPAGTPPEKVLKAVRQ